MIDDKDGHIPSPLIMFTCTALRHALLDWQKNKGVHPKASKSKLKADRPDCSNYFNCKNDGRKIASCCTVMGLQVVNLALYCRHLCIHDEYPEHTTGEITEESV